MTVEVVTAEGRNLSQDAEFVLAPGIAGDLGILPRHIPLLTPLRTGELMIRAGGEEQYFFVAGGFLEVLPDRVVILADVAERAEDIDEHRAREARQRAQEALADSQGNGEAAAALEHAIHRLRVAELRRSHPGRRGGSAPR